MILLLICFLAGILTVFAPCVLPLLPVIVGGSVGTKKQEKSRPYIISAALGVSVIFFTLLLKVSTILVNLSPQVLEDISGGLLIALGLVSMVPDLWEHLMIVLNLQAAAQRFLGKSDRTSGSLAGPILTGIALGPVFTSCSPTYAFILASILPHSFASGLIYLMVYTLGLVATLLAVSLLGRQLTVRFSWVLDMHGWFRRSIGLVFILLGVAIISGHETNIEVWVANHLPFDETRIERVLLDQQNSKTLSHPINSSSVLNIAPVKAPQFVGLTNWINSPPLKLSQLKGKVVLVDFWTYSCINCIRSIPYVEKWYTTYHDKGFTVIGVSTPEFAFEHVPANVEAAVKRFGITYPVALDNDDDTWNAYLNNSWPADYLIDKSGKLRYISLGEGNYPTTERAIQALLNIKEPLQTPISNVPISNDQTAETYFGPFRSQSSYIGSPDLNTGVYTFAPASALSGGQWTLGGSWNVAWQNITSNSNISTLQFNFSAKDVYMVAGSSTSQSLPVGIELSQNVGGQYGSDVKNGSVLVGGSRLYHIVSLKNFGSGTITLRVPKGVTLYTFTFGS